MKWIWITVAGVFLGLLVAAQFVIVGIAESEVEDRLTEGGGTAEADISAFPGIRLLWADGKRFEVSATDIDIDVTEDTRVFSSLDGFDEVQVTIADSQVGPFAIEDFSLTRDDDEPYQLNSTSTTSGAELVQFGAERIGIPGADVLGAITGVVEGAQTEVPVELSMQLESDDGQVQVVSGGGTVAGYPTGPLAELLTAAIVVQL